MMTNLNQRDRRAVMVGAALLVAILVVRYAVFPWFDHWSDQRDRIDSNTSLLGGLEAMHRRIEMHKTNLHALYGPAVDRALQDVQVTKVTFHKTVQESLKAAGLKFDKIREQKARPLRKTPGLVIVPLQLSGAKCKIDQLAKFLAKTRRSQMIIMVDRLNVAVSGDKLEVDIVVATLAAEERRS